MKSFLFAFAIFAFIYGPIWFRNAWDNASVQNGTHHWEWNHSHKYAARNKDINLSIHEANKKVLEHEANR